MNWDVILEHLPLFGKGILTSLFLLGISTVIGFSVSIPLAVMRVSHKPWVAGPVAAFTFVIRGTPAMVQLFTTPHICPVVNNNVPRLPVR